MRLKTKEVSTQPGGPAQRAGELRGAGRRFEGRQNLWTVELLYISNIVKAGFLC